MRLLRFLFIFIIIKLANCLEKRGEWFGNNQFGKVVVMKREHPIEKRGHWSGNNEFGKVVIMKRDVLKEKLKLFKRGTWTGQNFGTVTNGGNNIDLTREDNKNTSASQTGADKSKRGSWSGNNEFGKVVIMKRDVSQENTKLLKRDIFDMFENGIHVGNKHVIFKRDVEEKSKRGYWSGNNQFGDVVVMKREHPIEKRGEWSGNNQFGKVVVMKRDHPIEKRGSWSGNNEFGKVVIMKRDVLKENLKSSKRGTWTGQNFGTVLGFGQFNQNDQNENIKQQQAVSELAKKNNSIKVIGANNNDNCLTGNNVGSTVIVV